ncbi:nucleoside-diphosphate sugar epimerase [Pedobacter sp. KBW06]|uniref:NAD(P)H-binding protein n=1 Tax=Pedobacter sp. KBW06 TaxID=2153359 RepID=UPI000F590B7E|nr:NAD(P)H-binding protein [Pedobacter sp. KBW06]RQO67664.1 nucleoside-diphosphate sugar epimerase [Pedobacter sp. KBW06]
MEKKAVLFGASGLIGESLLEQLLSNSNYKEVLIVGRKKLERQHPKLKQLVVDFDKLSDYALQIQGDVVFCCLGTTKNKTPDQVQYKKIDYQYPLDAAAIAQSNGTEQYHLVSALGANPSSSIFYTKTKGEVERDLKAIPFKSVHIYQPSLLVGERKESRNLEGLMTVVMQILNPFLISGLRKYRSIKIEKVASAMLKKSLEDAPGTFVYPSDKIEEISSKSYK